MSDDEGDNYDGGGVLDDFDEPDEPNADDFDQDDGTAGLENDKEVVVGGDPSAAQTGNTVRALRDKQIPKEKRTTSPYMTKYERARVLGTRATQIRCAFSEVARLLKAQNPQTFEQC